MPTWEITTWIAVGASALAVVLLVATLALAVRLRRGGDAAQRAERDASRAWEEVHRERAQSTRARSELGWLRHLGDLGGVDALETTLRRVLESASGLADAAASMLALPQDDDDPLVATFGLNAEESSRELLGLPRGGEEARAVTLSYRYAEEEAARDEFRLSGGLALPLPDAKGAPIGTLGIFWRRVEREVTEEELEQLEGLAAALGPALTNAIRFEELRRELDVDPATGLRGLRSLRSALEVECARARRYTHPLSLLLLRVDPSASPERLGTAAVRLEAAVRATDVVYHLSAGRFAVLLPESSQRDAERLSRRLRFALGAKEAGVIDGQMPAAAVELRVEDDAVSVLARAEAAIAQAETGAGGSWSTAVEPGG